MADVYVRASSKGASADGSRLVSGPAGYHSTGKILVWDPPRVLEYEWNVAPVPEMPRGEHAIFRYELTPDGDSTQLLVTYRRITKQTARGFLPGLHAFLDRLEAQLDGRPLPDWTQRFGELRADTPNGAAMRPIQENDVFHAIAHPARRAILLTLKDGERAASELAEPFQMTFAAISQHLRVLEEAELVSVRREGRQRLYRLDPEAAARRRRPGSTSSRRSSASAWTRWALPRSQTRQAPKRRSLRRSLALSAECSGELWPGCVVPKLAAATTANATPRSSNFVTVVCRKSWNRHSTAAVSFAVTHAVFQLLMAFPGSGSV